MKNDRILLTEEAAEYLLRTPSALRNLVMRRKIPYRKVGGRLVFLKEELDRYIQEAPGVRLEDVNLD